VAPAAALPVRSPPLLLCVAVLEGALRANVATILAGLTGKQTSPAP
jgi:hypothetical protein